MKKNLLVIVAAIIVVIVAIFLTPKDMRSGFFTAGDGGINLQDMNKKDTTTASVNISLQANQTTEQNLEQALLVGNFYKQRGLFFLGGNIVSSVSTEFGVCCPILVLNTGIDLNKFKLELQAGNFGRSNIGAIGVDPQYGNFCIGMGESASVSNAMQLSLIKGNAKIAFGHQGGDKFYNLYGGNWYAFALVPVGEVVSLSGGVDFCEKMTGYAAAKIAKGNNAITLTANKLGSQDQNLILTYNRKNIAVMGRMIMISASTWAKAKEQGLHLVAGLNRGKGTFYAEAGSRLCMGEITPYLGLGTNFTF